MSIEALNHAITILRDASAEVRPLDRLVLLLLANRHNHDEGMAWPSLATLARECGVSERHVRRAIGRWERMGTVRRVVRRRHDGAQLTNGYQFAALAGTGVGQGADTEVRGAGHLDPRGADTEIRGGRIQVSGGADTEIRGGRTSRSGRGGSIRPPEPLGEPLGEPSEEPLGEPLAVAAAPAARLLTATWKTETGKAPTPAQIRKLAELEDAGIRAGRPELLRLTIRDAAERGKGWEWFVAAFQGRLTDRGDDRSAARRGGRRTAAHDAPPTQEDWERAAEYYNNLSYEDAP